jgi:hypothetical protein
MAPLAAIFLGICGGLFRAIYPEIRFDITHWVLLWAFNGLVCGGITALFLRLGIYVVDVLKGKTQ